MPAEFVTIAALLGRADAAYRYIGGSSIVSNFLRSFVFGKVLRTIEYPDGELASIRIRRTSMDGLRAAIAAAQPPPFPTAYVEPKDVRQIVLWTAPIFTEGVTSDQHVYNLQDNSWLFWSKTSEVEMPIPRRGVKIDGPPPKAADTQANLQDDVMATCQMLIREGAINSTSYEDLIGLAAERDPALLALQRNFRNDSSEFRRHALNLLKRRNLSQSPGSPETAERKQDKT